MIKYRYLDTTMDVKYGSTNIIKIKVKYISKQLKLQIIMIGVRNIIWSAKLIIKYRNAFCANKDHFSDGFETRYRPAVNVQQFLNRLAIDYRPSGKGFRIKQCYFCSKPHYNQLTNLYTLIVKRDSGVFFCHRCSHKGNWRQFQSKYLGVEATQFGQMLPTQMQFPQSQIPQVQNSLYKQLLTKQEYASVLSYAKTRGLTVETLNKYQVGATSENFLLQSGEQAQVKCLVFPVYQLIFPKKKKKQTKQQTKQQLQFKIVKIKVRGGSFQTRKLVKLTPIGSKTGFFGLNTIKATDKIVVITENQFDAMAINQQTGYPAISLPQGSSSLPDSLLPFLEQFEKIVLWLCNDQAGHLAEDKLAYKLGSIRTYVVRPHNQVLRDANDFLVVQPSKMKELIQASRTKPQQNIISFNDIKQAIRRRIFRHQQFLGVKLDSFKFFNDRVKGIRMQEISIVSGPTGSGKTTILSQMSLDLCKKQIPVLWGSFQINNQVLATNMLIQYAGKNLFQHNKLFSHYSQQFMKLPLYYLSFKEIENVEKVLATIEYTIQKHNIALVIIDTLQFLLSNQGEGNKKFQIQDLVISRLRKMSTDFNVHIAIVIHPRKVEETEDIQIQSIYGTSKAPQQADNIWILQNRPYFRVFDIKKNRFDGELGKAALGFNKQTKQYFQLNKNQITLLANQQATIQKIIERRQQKTEQQTKNEQIEDQD